MLVPARVHHALTAKRETFRLGLLRATESQTLYRNALQRLERLSMAEINARLGGVQWPGARPTSELDDRGLIVKFDRPWNHAQEARAWALERLRGVTTIGVDGSQIPPSREFGTPVALVQAAWFENPHEEGRSYVKDVRDDLLLPGESVEDSEDFAFGESAVNQRRYTLEMEVIRDCIESVETEPPPVVFHDGSLVLSFAGRLAPAARDSYLQALFSVLAASEIRRIPIVGYVDLSLASDLTSMVRTACDLAPAYVVDARLLTESMEAFDRTAVFQCARSGILPQYRTDEHDYSRDMYFSYLKIGQDRMPSRIDFPRWIFEARLIDHVMDIIRAEIVAGSGYPYALETADAAAVLTTEDRLNFYRMWHQFAATEELEVSMPSKQLSKLRRR